MRIKPTYLLSFFVLLIFFGFCDCFPITVRNTRDLRESEWIIKNSGNQKSLKSYHFKDWFTHSILHNFINLSKECGDQYTQIIRVSLLLQFKIFTNKILINLIQSRFGMPRLSIDDHINFFLRPRNLMCNNSNPSKWISLRRKFYAMESVL
jgi:hypothetical protein